MVARRLDRPLDPDAPVGPSVRFRWEGREVEGRAGEPLAVALLAAGHDVLSRSFRFHRPRGLMCATGACGWCECSVDGLASVKSCRTPVHAGLDARGEHAWPSVGTDLFAVLDAGNRAVTPGFYHHRFLRPHALRKRYLDVIRAFGGRGTVRPGPRARAGRLERAMAADVVVVGGGRSGLAAALAAARDGAQVAVLETTADAGGHAAWSADAEERRAIHALAGEAAGHPAIRLLLGTTAVTVEDGAVVAMGADAIISLAARTVVAATGSYERPPLRVGGELPGVMAARTVEWLVVRWGVVPGRRAAIVGSGPLAERLAAVLHEVGSDVVATVGPDEVQAVRGRGRVTGLRVAARGSGAATGSGSTTHAADLVAFTDRVPNLDLPLLAGAAVGWTGGVLHPLLGDDGLSSVPWLSVVGAAAGPAATVDPRPRTGEATAAARTGTGAPLGTRGPTDASPGAHVCYCEDVRVRDITREMGEGYREPELLKRRTGAVTGPCQGKLCLDRFLAVSATGDARSDGAWTDGGPVPTTARPPLVPIRLADLAGGVDATERAR